MAPEDPHPQGRLDHHDPTSRIGGAPPARSALTLRIVLAAFGLVTCAALAAVMGGAGAPGVLVGGLVLLAVVAAVDLVVVTRRKVRGEPG
ncbi:DUF6343 family protein [Actinotalea sp. K2]|uniref:DUF6343 family protein n=1 Tax=Actinotalea sp. K2 TaxID=2939438 RepID=UPI002018166E|nr:DUF6343 family protein [Actinotalea sp. K2]MCL3862884.1 DUF6343 family protein [Actinotalea sp. K2]